MLGKSKGGDLHYDASGVSGRLCEKRLRVKNREYTKWNQKFPHVLMVY